MSFILAKIFFRKKRIQRKEPVLRIVFDAKKYSNEKGNVIYLKKYNAIE
ncbi:MAG: hypothetical protein V3U92_13630 [Cellulophaga sp.]